jgi:hypothetical protein
VRSYVPITRTWATQPLHVVVVVVLAILAAVFAAEVPVCGNQGCNLQGSRNSPDHQVKSFIRLGALDDRESLRHHLPRRHRAPRSWWRSSRRRRRRRGRTGCREEAAGTGGGRRGGGAPKRASSRHDYSQPAPGPTASAEACAGSTAGQEEDEEPGRMDWARSRG